MYLPGDASLFKPTETRTSDGCALSSSLKHRSWPLFLLPSCMAPSSFPRVSLRNSVTQSSWALHKRWARKRHRPLYCQAWCNLNQNAAGLCLTCERQFAGIGPKPSAFFFFFLLKKRNFCEPFINLSFYSFQVCVPST